LFDANRQVLYEQTCDDIDGWMNDLENQIENEDYDQVGDLASVNILMQKQQVKCGLVKSIHNFIADSDSWEKLIRMPLNVDD